RKIDGFMMRNCLFFLWIGVFFVESQPEWKLESFARLYGYGHSDSGKLGQTGGVISPPAPLVGWEDLGIEALECGGYHNVIVTSDFSFFILSLRYKLFFFFLREEKREISNLHSTKQNLKCSAFSFVVVDLRK